MGQIGRRARKRDRVGNFGFRDQVRQFESGGLAVMKNPDNPSQVLLGGCLIQRDAEGMLIYKPEVHALAFSGFEQVGCLLLAERNAESVEE